MDKIREFGDAIAAIGIYIIKREDYSILYFNKKIAAVCSDIKIGMKCSECFQGACDHCPIGTIHTQENNLSIAYVEEWNGFVEMSADEYMWEGSVPAYIITMVPQMQAVAVKESVRYNKMMEKAAITLSESLAYGNFTKNTYTKYVPSNAREVSRGKVEPLEGSYLRFLSEIHPDDKAEFEAGFSVERLRERIRESDGEIYGEFRKGRDGKYRWISFRCIPIMNPFDEDELCVFIVRDIHVRKQMQQQLAIQLNATYQSIPGGVAVMRMDEQLSLVNASDGFYEMMHKTREDYGEGYLSHIFREDRKQVKKRIRALANLGEPFDIIYREADSKQIVHWVQARGSKIGEEDGTAVYLIIRMDVSELKSVQQQLMKEQRQYRVYTEGIIDTLSNLVEFRDLDSGEHVKRTRILTKILLENLHRKHPELGITEDSIAKISEAAALHDIGKIAISDTILNKPGRLTTEEFEEMKKHTVKGYEILKTLNLAQDEEQLRYSLDISRHHHERWDGNGYPDRLKGGEIPIWSQVVSVVDVYDALVSPRIYKKAYSHKEAIQMILNGECGSFNPEILECLRESMELLEREYMRIA